MYWVRLRCSDLIYSRAAEFVGAGTSQNLDLRIAASQFGVDRR